MFTGIIETQGEVVQVDAAGSNRTFTIVTSLAAELRVDQSVAHDGACLTVVDVRPDRYCVTAIDETLGKTTLGDWRVGTRVNLERSMPATGRFDGHLVQGHVDQTGTCLAVQTLDGSWLFDFSHSPAPGHFTVEKGSVCINGVSLTVFNAKDDRFRVAIIPYTYAHTNFDQLRAGSRVNLEFDIVGKYVQKMLAPRFS